MGTINIAYFKPRSEAGYSVIGPVRAVENLTTNNSSSTAGNDTAQLNEVCMVTADEDIYIKVGSSPTAASGDLLIKSGIPTAIFVPEGQKVGIIDSA